MATKKSGRQLPGEQSHAEEGRTWKHSGCSSFLLLCFGAGHPDMDGTGTSNSA